MRRFPKWRFVWLVSGLLLPTIPGASAPLPATKNAPAFLQEPRLDRYGDPLPDHAVARLGTVRLRHSAQVNSIEFSPDGKLLASAGDDACAILWDVATGKAVRRLPHPGAVSAVLFTPDGKTLLSASTDNNRAFQVFQVHVTDVGSGQELRSLKMPEPNGLACMVLSPDGKILVTNTVFGPIVAWDLATGGEIWRVANNDWRKCMALSPDGRTLATGSTKGDIALLDVQTGEAVREAEPFFGRGVDIFCDVLSLAFSPDGRILVSTSECSGDSSYWDVATGERVQPLGVCTCFLAPIAFSGDGQTLACGSRHTIHLFDPVTREELERFEAHESWIRSVAFSPDGRYLASAGQDHTIRIWNLATMQVLHPFAREPGGTHSAAFTHDSRQLISSNSCNGHASNFNAIIQGRETCSRRLWDARSVEGIQGSAPQEGMSGPGLDSPDGNAFARSDRDGLVRLVDARSGEDLCIVGKKGEAFEATPVAFSSGGRIVAVLSNELGPVFTTRGGARKDRLRLWNVATGELVAAVIGGDELNELSSLQIAPRGRLLTAVDGGLHTGAQPIGLWHLNGMNSIRRLDIPETLSEYQPKCSADGWLLITRQTVQSGTDQEGTERKQMIRIREVLTGKELLCLRDQRDVACYTLSPDHRVLALGDSDGTIRLIDVSSGKELQPLRGHRGRIESLEFSADGTLLVSGSADTTALVWDVRPFLTQEHVANGGLPGESIWADLASTDARRAFRAEQRLRAGPEQSVALLGSRLVAVPLLDPRQVELLIADLDHEDFEVRERATMRLDRLEQSAVPVLKAALAAPRSPELRRRLESLLRDVDEPRHSMQRVRDLRAIHALRAIGTPQAREVLQRLANGAPEARLTQEAREELKWLE
jgi:WD40 repeat protein